MKENSPRVQAVLGLLADGERWHPSDLAAKLGVGLDQTRKACALLHQLGRAERYEEHVVIGGSRHLYQIKN